MTARDADGGSFGSISYSLSSGIKSASPSQFTIGKETGQICTTAVLDRDHGPASFDFTVTAVDGVSFHILKYGLYKSIESGQYYKQCFFIREAKTWPTAQEKHFDLRSQVGNKNLK